MTSLFNYLHQFSFPSGTTVTTGVNFQEPIAPIKLQQYLFDVGVSADPTSQDSVFFTTSNALTSSGALSNTKPECYLNSIAYKNWSGYAGGTSPTLTTLDPPLFSNNNYVCWGVAVFPYSNADGHTSFHAIIAADAPKTKVLRFLEQ